MLEFDLQALQLVLDPKLKKKKKKKKCSVTCNTDQQVEGSKIFILSLGLNRRGRFQFKKNF